MMNEVRVVVMGSHDWTKYSSISMVLDHYMSQFPLSRKIVFVSGTCPGVDMLGEQYAYEHDIGIVEFPLEKKKYGNAAVKIRNQNIVDYITADNSHAVLFAFWNGKSKGTKDMLRRARKSGIEIHKIMVK